MKILVAEDEAVTRRKLVSFLSEWGFETLETDNGLEAFNILSTWSEPGIAVLDWEMPGLEGIEICKKARMDPDLKNIYFIMVTSRKDRKDMMTGFEAGVDDYLSKPFDRDELKARVKVGERIVDLEKELEKRAAEAEGRYLRLFESSTGGILQIDTSYERESISSSKIIAANPIICSILGRTRQELLSMHLQEIVNPGDHLKLDRMRAESGDDNGKGGIFEIQFLRSDGGHIWGLTSFAELAEPSGKRDHLILHIEDISERKAAHMERMKKILNYKLDEGNVYLVTENVPSTSIEAFKDLISIGFHGTVISRRPKDQILKKIGGDFSHYWLTDEDTSGSVKPDPKTILKLLNDLPHREMIFIDRLDYLISKSSFLEVLHLVQSLKDFMVLHDSISILTIDPATLTDKETAYLMNECSEMEPIFKYNISEDLFDLLKVVQKKILNHVDATISGIEEELHLSRPTTRKRINRLVDFDYLIEVMKGREKAYILSERGYRIVEGK